MKQAIQEGFILDVLKYYTPITSYYKLIKTLADDPQFDKKKAQKKLRKFAESDSYPIAIKAEMMVEHFHEQVIAKGKIGGKARAMVVTAGIDRAIDYYHAINSCHAARKSPYKSIIAFSGEKEYGGAAVSEATLNGFPSSAIEKTFKADPYRFLIVADKCIVSAKDSWVLFIWRHMVGVFLHSSWLYHSQWQKHSYRHS